MGDKLFAKDLISGIRYRRRLCWCIGGSTTHRLHRDAEKKDNTKLQNSLNNFLLKKYRGRHRRQ